MSDLSDDLDLVELGEMSRDTNAGNLGCYWDGGLWEPFVRQILPWL